MDAHHGAEVIGNPAGVSSRIVAPITDEDVVRGSDLLEILDWFFQRVAFERP
jgi:hypothetical protein